MKNEYAKDINISRHDFFGRTFWKVKCAQDYFNKNKKYAERSPRVGVN